MLDGELWIDSHSSSRGANIAWTAKVSGQQHRRFEGTTGGATPRDGADPDSCQSRYEGMVRRGRKSAAFASRADLPRA